MSVDEHIAALRTKHAELEESLVSETTRPHPDQSLISDLKKQKLKIKDQLAQLSDH